MKTTELTTYQQYIARKWFAMVVTLGLLIMAALWSISAGSAGLTIPDILEALFHKGQTKSSTIIWNVRLPRVCTALVIGAGLAVAGCVMQNVLRNPMASASTLGVSQGACFGAATAIVFLDGGIQVGNTVANFTVTSIPTVSAMAFAGGMTTTVVILALSRGRKSSPATMVLAGVALSSIFSGMTTLIQYFADDVQTASLVYWTFGSLNKATWQQIGIMTLITVAAFLYFYYHRLKFNAMEAGVATAKSLGVPVDRLTVISMILCALVSSVSVAFAGSIGFIGLIASHIMRKFVGNDYRFLLPGSALGGAALMLLADVASRIILPPVVLPIGALTSFMGGPMFLYLCLKGGKKT